MQISSLIQGWKVDLYRIKIMVSAGISILDLHGEILIILIIQCYSFIHYQVICIALSPINSDTGNS